MTADGHLCNCATSGSGHLHHALDAPLFQRRELKAQSVLHLEGMLCTDLRRSAESMGPDTRGAESNAVGTAQLIECKRHWLDDAQLQPHLEEEAKTLGQAEGVLIVDGIDLCKQGYLSVGVAR